MDRLKYLIHLLPTGSEGRGGEGIGSIHVVILHSYQDGENIALELHKRVWLGSKNKEHLRGSTQVTIHPLAIIY